MCLSLTTANLAGIYHLGCSEVEETADRIKEFKQVYAFVFITMTPQLLGQIVITCYCTLTLPAVTLYFLISFHKCSCIMYGV